jgi:hypothetical protein
MATVGALWRLFAPYGDRSRAIATAPVGQTSRTGHNFDHYGRPLTLAVAIGPEIGREALGEGSS